VGYLSEQRHHPESNQPVLRKLNQYLGTSSTYKSQPQKAEPNPVPVRRTKVAQPKTKPAKAKADRSKKPVKPGKKVEHIREELKFIKRFVALHNKVKSPNSVLSLLKGLQKAIIQKLIKKTSPLAKEIQAIQDKLVNLYTTKILERNIQTRLSSLSFSIPKPETIV